MFTMFKKKYASSKTILVDSRPKKLCFKDEIKKQFEKSVTQPSTNYSRLPMDFSKYIFQQIFSVT